ncbi:MAG: hypothetical protein HIU91_03065 [Acidobacteria bacterium]|nr:hypothetical protein [Acidobacteriota bacterium]
MDEKFVVSTQVLHSFVEPTVGTYGNLERNQVYGAGFGDVDLSLVKTTPIYKERVSAQFRVDPATFGQSTSTIGIQEGAPGIGSAAPYKTRLAMKILF